MLATHNSHRFFGLTPEEVAHLLHLVRANDLYDPFGVRERLTAKLAEPAKEPAETGSRTADPS